MVDWRRIARKLGVVLNLRDPPNVPPFGWSYFDHLVSVYVTLNTPDQRAETVITKASTRPDDITWGDIFLLENVVFSLQPPETVNRNAWIVRERFREIAGPAVYEHYIESNPPKDSDTPAKLALLRADLNRLLDVLHWYYSLIPMRERIRKSLTMRCIFYVVLHTVMLGITLAVCYAYRAEFLAMLAVIVYWGILGGFVSSQRRMQKIPNNGDPLIAVFGLDSAGYYLWLSPLLGAIFAVILALMFMGGVLQGTVFPAFYAPGHAAGLTFFTFTWTTLPVSAVDYAKLFLWAFLAGFAERLVPDSLDHLSSKLEPEEKKKAPPAARQHPETVRPEPPPSPGPQPVPSGAPVQAPAAAADQKLSPDVLETVMHTGEVPPEGKNGDKKSG